MCALVPSDSFNRSKMTQSLCQGSSPVTEVVSTAATQRPHSSHHCDRAHSLLDKLRCVRSGVQPRPRWCFSFDIRSVVNNGFVNQGQTRRTHHYCGILRGIFVGSSIGLSTDNTHTVFSPTIKQSTLSKMRFCL